MRKALFVLWILLIAALPALAVPGKRAFLAPQRVADSSWVKKVVTGDFDGDGRLDFATLSWEIDGRCVIAGIEYKKGFLVRVYRNTTPPGALNPTFAPPEELAFIDDAPRLYPLWSSDITVADVNHDGKDDILVANTHADWVFTYLSRGKSFAPPIVTITEDDPTYIATGDFDADGKMDIALLHMSRNLHATDFHWKFSFYFGDGAGNFGRPVVQDLGSWSFPGDNGPFYNSTSFQFTGIPGGVRTGTGLLDSVYMNGPMKWLDKGAIVTDGGEPVTSFRRLPWSYGVNRRPGAKILDLAEAGGRLFFTEVQRLGDAVTSQDDSTLAPVFLNADGTRDRLSHFGAAVVLADFDRDGRPDLAMLSDEILPDVPNQSARSIFIAYGDPGSPHPLSIKGSSALFTDRFKLLDNLSGVWSLGHKAWSLAAGDFNGDGYPDLIANTAGGIVIDTNIGELAFDTPVPRIVQTEGIGAKGNASPDRIGLLGDFVTRGYKVGSVFFTPVGAPRTKINVAGTLDATKTPQEFTFLIPPDDLIPPGNYVLSVYNGIAESATINPPITVRLRPVSILAATPTEPAVASPTFQVTVTGWFGNDTADQAMNVVSVIEARRPGVKVPVTASYPSLGTLTFKLPVGGPFNFMVAVDHPRRGSAVSPSFGVDYSPKITFIKWVNTDMTTGNTKAGTLVPIQPGAQMFVEGSFLLAPDTQTWHLLKGLTEVKMGAGAISNAFADKDNHKATFVFTLPSDVKDDSGLTLQLTTLSGLTTSAFGPLTVKAGSGTGTGTDKAYWYTAEGRASFICTPVSFGAKSDADAAAAIEKMFPAASFVDTKQTEADFMTNPCHWMWFYRILDGAGTDLGEDSVEAATREIADEAIKIKIPAGGSASFTRGPVK